MRQEEKAWEKKGLEGVEISEGESKRESLDICLVAKWRKSIQNKSK